MAKKKKKELTINPRFVYLDLIAQERAKNDPDYFKKEEEGWEKLKVAAAEYEEKLRKERIKNDPNIN